MLGGCSVMLEVVTGTECAPQQTQNGTAIQYYPTPPFLTPWVEKIPLLFNVPLL
jgi:hypothetical protein